MEDIKTTDLAPKETADTGTEETGAVAAKKKKRKKKQVSKGRVYVQATYNNTIVTFTDSHGNALAQSSAGACGFKGPKKSTPYAAGVIVKTVAEKVRDMGLKEVEVFIKGIGSGREGAVRALNAQGFNMTTIRDITPIPHNGPRAKKPRRV
ncbi:MAG: 30S ribosomal protein S11 [Patescibacteria group bacterium]